MINQIMYSSNGIYFDILNDKNMLFHNKNKQEQHQGVVMPIMDNQEIIKHFVRVCNNSVY